jgi:hypothetical protein
MSSALSSAPGLSVRTLRSLAELGEVEDFWRQHCAHPWSDLDYLRLVLAAQPGFLRPHVLVLARAGRMVALVAATLRDESLPLKVGSFVLWKSRARVLHAGAGGAMGEDSPEVARAVRDEFQAALARGEADAAYAHQIEAGGALAAALADVPALARDRRARPSAGWLLELPASAEEFLASRSKSTRRHLKRYANALERELGAELALTCHRTPAELERLIQDSETIAGRTYHRGLGVGFADTPELRRLFAFAAERGWLAGYVLRARGRPIAFWHGLLYRGTFVTRDTGFDPEFRALRPGQYLLQRVIAEHCTTRETSRFDYGVMELDYKKNFGSRRYEKSSPYVFSRRPRGVWLWGLRSLYAALERLARRVLGERARGFARRIARLWSGGTSAEVLREEVSEEKE